MKATNFTVEAWPGERVNNLLSKLYPLAGQAAVSQKFRPMDRSARLELLEQELPITGCGFEELFDYIEANVIPYPMGNGDPRFFGWGNPPAELHGVVGSLIGAAMNPSCAGGDHAAIYLERCTVRWLAELLGYPATFGLLTSGGSMASLIGLVAARHWVARRQGWDVRVEGMSGAKAGRLRIYATAQAHSAITKAVELLGFGRRAIHVIAEDAHGRLEPAALRRAIADDLREHLEPFCVIASAGNVNSGAIDPIEAIAGICSDHGLWLHIDGAIDLILNTLPEFSAIFRGLDAADSVAYDPHKWMSVPADCGCVLVRDEVLLRDAFSFVPEYLRTTENQGFGGLPWYSEYGVEQTRPFRALRLWFAIKALGVEGIRQNLRRNVEQARRFAAAVECADRLSICAPPYTQRVLFRWLDDRVPAVELDEINRRIAIDLQTEGDVFLTSTQFDGRVVLRASFMHSNSTDADIDAIVPAVERIASAATATK